MKVLLSGGHLTPALALIDYLQAEEPKVEVVFAGRLYSQDKLKQQAQEHSELAKRQIPFVPFVAPRFDRANPWFLLPLMGLRVAAAIVRACWLMIRIRPSVFVSFGGYLAVPLAIAAWLFGVPVITHEQTQAPGQANRIIGRVAKRIAVGFAEAANYFPAHKTVVTGNPIRPELLVSKPARPSWLAVRLPAKPLLYITGGNQGSQIINDVVGQILPQLTKQWVVVHQCGGRTATTDYRSELAQAQERLSPAQQQAYYVQEWVTTADLAWLYRQAHGVISRSGANTVTELATLAIPSILIPLPFAYAQEQQKNAEWLAADKGALILPQREFTPSSLLAAVQQLKRQRLSMKSALKHVALPTDASHQLWQLVKATAAA